MNTGTTTHQSTLTIELSGHKGYGVALDVEVEFTKTPDIPARSPDMRQPGEPACGGDVEITDIRPFRHVRVVLASGRKGLTSRKEYLTAPDWLRELILDCIDTSLLTGED